MKKSLMVLVTLTSSIAGAQPTSIMVQNSPGGFVDSSARIVVEQLNHVLDNTIIVDNRPGGNGTIAATLVANAKTDGHTLLAGQSTFQTAIPFMMPSIKWDPVNSFVPIGLLAVSQNVLVVNASLPVNTVAELVTYLKAHPGQLNIASAGVGSGPHLAAEVFQSITGTTMAHIPYKSTGQAIPDLVSNLAQVMIATPPSVSSFIKSGKLKALAVTGNKRHPMLPDVPTTKEAGIPGFQVTNWIGLYAPAGTPQDIVVKYNDALKVALSNKDAREKAELQGIELQYSTPDELADKTRKEYVYWGKVVKSKGIRLD